MLKVSPLPTESPTKVAQRRKRVRETMVLRVGIIDDGRLSSFCVLRNISTAGVQVKLFGEISAGTQVRLRVGDEDPLSGHVVWVRDRFAGIEFDRMLAPDQMLRVAQKLASTRRRSSPRLSTTTCAILRTCGRTYAAELCDISTSGARVRTRTETRFGLSVTLNLPHLPAIKCYVRWVTNSEIGLSFETPLPIQIIADWIDERVSVSLC
jgi:hypothetical protein